METNLLDRMLSTYLASRTPVVITLQNKIRVSGTIKAFDSYVILLDNQKREIVYRHAVSSITAASPDDQKRPVPIAKPLPARAPARQTRQDARPRSSQPSQTLSASSGDSINSSMKEGLLKWMQENKAAK